MTKLLDDLANMTMEEVIGQSAAKLKQLAKELKLIGAKGMESEYEIKGMVVTLLAEKGLVSGSSRGEIVGPAGGGVFQQGLIDMKDELKTMISQFMDTQTASAQKIAGDICTMQQSFSQLSGFVEDFKGKLTAMEKEAAEGRAKQGEMERAIKGITEAKTKQEGALKALEERYRADQVSKDALLARMALFEADPAERFPPPPNAAPQVLAQRITNLERTEAAEDRPAQEKVKLDLRVTGLGSEFDQDSESDLLEKVTQSLGEQVGLSGTEMGITGVRVHRVRMTRGGKASTGNTPPPPPPPQIIVTCSSLQAKLNILRNKMKTANGVRISSELTPWQVRQKSSRWERYSALKSEGKTVFFLGHRLYVQEGEGRSAVRNEVMP